MIFKIMKCTFFGFIFVFASSLCACEKATQNEVDCLKENLEQKNEKAYLACWPGSFSEFDSVFGYKDMPDGSTNFGPLYDESFRYVNFYFEAAGTLKVSYEEFYRQLISLSLGGYWQADAVNFFQREIKQQVSKDFDRFSKVLSSFSVEEIQKFWAFYFDTAHGLKYDKKLCTGKSEVQACEVLLNEITQSPKP